jgi:alkaline phosphatase
LLFAVPALGHWDDDDDRNDERNPAFGHPKSHATLPPEPISDPPTGGPTMFVWPPHGTRFAPGQKFDIRVEGTGTGGFSCTMTIDGVPAAFTSGTANPTTTDGISSPGWGGFNLRGYSNRNRGLHVIDATLTSSAGTKRVRSYFVIEDLRSIGGSGWGDGHGRQVKNVIVLLGDGMGAPVRTAARVARFGATRGVPNGWLEMDKFPSQNMVSTYSLNSYVTDSAPGFTAYMSGTHQNNNQEGVFPSQVTNPFFQPRVEYLSEYLHRTKGTSTGIVTTAEVVDATPGGMATHTGNRASGSGIADQFLDESDLTGARLSGTGLKVLMGGGRRWFTPAGGPGSARTAATDYPALPADLVAAWNLPVAGAVDTTRNLLTDFQTAGFTYVADSTALNASVASAAPDKLLGLFHSSTMNVALDKVAKRRNVPIDGAVAFAASLVPLWQPYAVDNDGFPDQPMLDEMATAAIAVLRNNPRGFVLLIEGASIDKAEHAQDADRTIGDTIEFDRAIGVARRFAEQDGNTLVLVLTDHECSGFSPMGGLRNPVTGSNAGSLAYLKGLSSDAAALNPTPAPQRQGVVGVFEGAGFPAYSVMADGYPADFNIDGKILVGYGASADRYEPWLVKPLPNANGVGPFESANGFFIRGQSAARSVAVHSGSDVPLSAYAKDRDVHEVFRGAVYQNIDVFFRILSVARGDHGSGCNGHHD